MEKNMHFTVLAVMILLGTALPVAGRVVYVENYGAIGDGITDGSSLFKRREIP